MTRKVLIVSHADADGHLIAEQVRRNLTTIETFEVAMVVDPNRTRDHKTWRHLNAIPEIEDSEIIFFVDLMFAPASFRVEADALVSFVRARPAKKFFLIDHHPLPLGRLSRAPNLRAQYRQDVLDCTFGPSSWLMILAALCEKQPTRAKSMKEPVHDVLAQAMRRAAAPGGALPGEKLSALLRFDRWEALQRLGEEDPAKHRLPRGRRRADEDPSEALVELDRTATALLHSSLVHEREGEAMSYDFESAVDSKPPKITERTAQAQDLEAIVMLLELAAIYLTPEPDTEFTLDELLAQARDISGGDIEIDKKDALIVLDKAEFLKKKAQKRFVLKSA